MKPDFDTLRPIPWHEGTVLLMAHILWEDGRDVVASPRQILRRQLDAPGRARLAGDGGDRARVHRLPRLVRAGVGQGLPRPRAGQRVQRRLFDDRDRASRAADPPDPQLDDGRGNAGGELEGRVQLRPARDQLPLPRTRSQRRTTTSSTRPGRRRSQRRRRWRSPSWRSTTSARANSCHIHCSLAGEGATTSSAGDEALFDRFVAGQLACLRELTLFFAPHVNSYKRFAAGSFAPTAVAWGKDNRTCSLRVGRATARRCGSSAASPAPTSTPTWPMPP